MPCWYFEKTELGKTPSITDGIAHITEARYRREGIKLIVDAGAALGLHYDVCATAAVYFHRFYMFHSFCDFHRYVTGTTCLFLAAKLEENSVTWASLSETVQSLLSKPQLTVFGENSKEEVMATEKILLEALKFDLVVDLPYNYLLKFIKLLKGEPGTVEQLLKMSWTFINDSLCTTLCIQWEPELIALSVLYLSCHLIKFTVADWQGKPTDYNGKWYQYFVNDANINIIENICRQVLGVYTSHREEESRLRDVKSSEICATASREQKSAENKRSLSPFQRSPQPVSRPEKTKDLSPMSLSPPPSLSARKPRRHPLDDMVLDQQNSTRQNVTNRNDSPSRYHKRSPSPRGRATFDRSRSSCVNRQRSPSPKRSRQRSASSDYGRKSRDNHSESSRSRSRDRETTLYQSVVQSRKMLSEEEFHALRNLVMHKSDEHPRQYTRLPSPPRDPYPSALPHEPYVPLPVSAVASYAQPHYVPGSTETHCYLTPPQATHLYVDSHTAVGGHTRDLVSHIPHHFDHMQPHTAMGILPPAAVLGYPPSTVVRTTYPSSDFASFEHPPRPYFPSQVSRIPPPELYFVRPPQAPAMYVPAARLMRPPAMGTGAPARGEWVPL